MKPVTIEAFRADPGLVAALHRGARKARAVAVHDALVRLVHKLTPRLHVGRWGAHWG